MSVTDAKVRDVLSGRMCQVLREAELRALQATREDVEVLALTKAGVVQIKETVAL